VLFRSVGAPLAINVGGDILKEITISKDKVAFEVFDEVQEEVYCMFVSYILEEFQKSPYMSALEEQQKDTSKYSKSIIFTSVYDVFKPSSKEIAEITDLISNAQRTTFDYGFRHKILQKTIQLFFPKSKFTEINGYFNDSSQLSMIQKQRQIGKGKKIAKFFGEHISFDALKNQLPIGQSTGSSTPENVTTPIKALKEGRIRRSRSTDTFDSQDSREVISDKKLDLLMKKKKMDKLQAFFGDVPIDQDADNGLPSVAVDDDDSIQAAYVPPTFNELNPLEKSMLQKRQRKIQHVFGEKIDEHMAFKIATGTKQYSKEIEDTEKISSNYSLNNTKPKALVRSRSSEYDVAKPRNSKISMATEKSQRRTSVVTIASTNSTRSLNRTPDEKQIIRKKFTKLTAVLGDPLLNRTEIVTKSSVSDGKWAEESAANEKKQKKSRKSKHY